MKATARGDGPHGLDPAVADADVVVPTIGHGVLVAARQQKLFAELEPRLAARSERDVLLVQCLDLDVRLVEKRPTKMCP